MPTASGRTITVPGSTAGSGTSSIAISSGPFHTMAFKTKPPLLESPYKDSAYRGAVRSHQLERQAREEVLTQLHPRQHQTLEDDHVSPQQRVVSVELLILEGLDGEIVHTHHLHPDLDQILRGLQRDGRVVLHKPFAVQQPLLRVPGLEEEPGRPGDLRGFEVAPAHVPFETGQVHDPARPHAARELQ